MTTSCNAITRHPRTNRSECQRLQRGGIGAIFRLFWPRAGTGVEAGPAVLPVALIRGSSEIALAVDDMSGGTNG